MFVSYLEIMRSGSSQYFIMTFMIITVALGILIQPLPARFFQMRKITYVIIMALLL